MKYEATDEERKKMVVRCFFTDKTLCSKCKRSFSKEYAYKVYRWDSGMSKKLYVYCKRCATSVDSVLSIIDNDEIQFGIVFADSFLDYEKKSTVENDHFVYNLLKKLSLK